MLKLSVIIAVRNGWPDIKAAINSWRPVLEGGGEIIVFDANSNDGTSEYLRAVSELVHVREADEGLYDAWNKGLSRALYDYVIFAAADDTLISASPLYSALADLESSPELVAAHGKTRMQRADGKIRYAGAILHSNRQLGEMKVATPATVFKKNALTSVGGFCNSLAYSADFEMVTKLLSKYQKEKFYFLDEPVVNFSLNGMSNASFWRPRIEIVRIVHRHENALLAAMQFGHYVAVFCKKLILSCYVTIRS